MKGAWDEKGTGWVSKAAVLLVVAAAWLSPVPGLERMGNPTVSPRVGVQLTAATTAPPLKSEGFFASKREFLETSLGSVELGTPLCVDACLNSSSVVCRRVKVCSSLQSETG